MVFNGAAVSRYDLRAKKKELSSEGSLPTVVAEEFLAHGLGSLVEGCVSGSGPSDAWGSRSRQFAESSAAAFHDAWLLDFSHNPLPRRALCDLALSERHNEDGQPEPALRAAQGAERIFASSGNSAGVQRARLEQLYALQRMVEPQACVRLASRTLALNPKRYPWINVQATLERSICESMLGDLGSARRHVESAVRMAEESGLQIAESRASSILAEQYLTEGSKSRIWNVTYAEVRRAHIDGFPPARLYQLYAGLAFSAEREEQWELASALCREGEVYLARTQNRSTEAMSLYRLGTDELMAGHFKQAGYDFRSSQIMFAALPQSKVLQIYTAYGQTVRAAFLAHAGDLRASVPLLESARDKVRGLDDYVIPLTFYSAEAQAFIQQKRFDEAETSLRRAIDLSEPALRSMKSSADRVGLDLQLRELYRQLVRIYATVRSEPERGAQAWQHYLDISAHGTAAAAGNEIRPSMLSGRTVFFFVVYADGIAAWMMDDRGTRFHWTALQIGALESTIANLHDLCSNPLSDMRQIDSASRQLYQWLLAPFQSAIHTSDLEIEPDGELAAIPFAALHGSPGSPTPRSISLLLGPIASRQEALPSYHKIVIFGGTGVSRDGLLPVAEAREEARAIAASFPAAIVSTDTALSVPGVQAKAFTDADLVHFAGHAVRTNSATELLLKTSLKSGTLTPASLEKENFSKCRLFMLAGCNTAGFGGPEDLPSVLIRAGAHRVIATQWDVDSHSTHELMMRFYELLARGVPADVALFSAQARLKQDRPHPYYWSGLMSWHQD